MQDVPVTEAEADTSFWALNRRTQWVDIMLVFHAEAALQLYGHWRRSEHTQVCFCPNRTPKNDFIASVLCHRLDTLAALFWLTGFGGATLELSLMVNQTFQSC